MTKYIALLIHLCGLVGLGSFPFDNSDSLSPHYTSIASNAQAAASPLMDSLLHAAVTDEQLIQAYSTAAKDYTFAGQIDSAILYADKASAIARSIFHTSWQVRTSLQMATIYREVELYSFARKYMDEARDLNEKQRHTSDYLQLRVHILQQKAQHAFEQHAYEAGLKHVQEAIRLSPDVKAQEATIRLTFATNDYLLGQYHLQQGNLEKSDSSYAAALEQLGGRFAQQKATIYSSRAEVALQAHEFENARVYLDSATALVPPYTVSKLKLELLNDNATYYWNTGDFLQAREYESLASTLKEELTEKTKTISDDLLYQLSISQEALSSQNLVFILVNISLVAVLIILFVYLFIFRRPKSRHTGSPVEAPPMLNTPTPEPTYTPIFRDEPDGHPLQVDLPIDPALEQGKDSTDPSDVHIAKETEDRLLEKLLEQESQHFYLRKRLTRASFAKLMGTNHRYISYMIRKYRGKDFQAYVQSCRIAYILQRLDTDETLWDQKISALANLAGFLDQGKFSIAFKAATGLSPTAYISKKKHEASSESMC